MSLQKLRDTYVAAAFTITNQSSAAISDDINLDVRAMTPLVRVSNRALKTASGPSFPTGEFNVAPGGTASGWVML
jgi:hypothetical protein